MIPSEKIEKIKDIVQKAENIHVYTHAHPDGDAISSLAAINLLLNKMGKTVLNRLATPIAPMYQWFHLSTTNSKTLPLPDAIIGVDFGERQQLGSLSKIFRGDIKTVPTINIDHHISANREYGSINVVVNTASTTQIIFDLFQKWPLPIDENLATILLYGLVSDTYYFQKANTDLAAFRVAEELVRLGANPHVVAQKLHKSKSLLSLSFWGQVLSSIKLYQNGQIAVGSISNEMFKKYGAEEYSLNLDGLVNFMTAVETTKITMLLKERKEEVRVSFRSDFYESSEDDTKLEIINVGKIANKFGGGGHLGASGCSILSPLKEAESLLIQACLIALEDPTYREYLR